MLIIFTTYYTYSEIEILRILRRWKLKKILLIYLLLINY